MKNKGKWAILIVGVLLVSLVLVSNSVVACFYQTTTCEGEDVYQGDGGATEYWFWDLYPPAHYIDPGMETEWIITVAGGGGCSDYEHATITDNDAPAGWTTTIEMGDIYVGTFTYISGGGPVIKGDDIEGKEFYIGNNWDFDIVYKIQAPGGAMGGEHANMTCTVYLVGYVPENQHDYVYVHCEAIVNAVNQPIVIVLDPNGGDIYSSWSVIMWDAMSPIMPPEDLFFDILLSSDGGVTYPDTIAVDLSYPAPPFFFDWDTTAHPDDIDYRIQVIAFDGTNYGYDISDGDFAIDNYGPDPPTELTIYLGLTSNGEPSSKSIADNTDSPLERLQKDDSRGYVTQKGKTLQMETFDTATQNAPVESAELYVEYWVENDLYSGTNSVMWKLQTDITFTNTGIKPLPADMTAKVGKYDLYAQGVDTIDEIANLDIQFINNDGGIGENVSFDYIWIKFKASSNDLGLTWKHAYAPDFSHYRIYRSPDDISYAMVAETTAITWNDDGGKGVDLNNYFYKVYSVDLGGKEGDPTYTVGKYVTPVTSDWNMVSLPLKQQGDGSFGAALESLDGNYVSLQTFDAGHMKPWSHWHESKPSQMNRLTDMDHTNGYYINIQSSGHMKTLGILPSNEIISLKNGWNLVGYPSLLSLERDTALSSISGNYDAVMGMDPLTGKYIHLGPTNLMDPGNAYWIHVTSDCDLTI
jgi:hypothetical protein